MDHNKECKSPRVPTALAKLAQLSTERMGRISVNMSITLPKPSSSSDSCEMLILRPRPRYSSILLETYLSLFHCNQPIRPQRDKCLSLLFLSSRCQCSNRNRLGLLLPCKSSKESRCLHLHPRGSMLVELSRVASNPFA